MANTLRTLHRLTDRAGRNATKPLNDGGGLWIFPRGTLSWFLRYQLAGRARQMALGRYPDMLLAAARALAADARKVLAQGIDPLEHRDAQAKIRALNESRSVTFTQATARYIRAHRRAWKSRQHAQRWARTLRVYAKPFIGAMDVADIGTDDALRILGPIWLSKTATAAQVRARVERVLDWAIARQYRTAANPARWRGHLDTMLAGAAKVAPVTHHPAIPFQELPKPSDKGVASIGKYDPAPMGCGRLACRRS